VTSKALSGDFTHESIRGYYRQFTTKSSHEAVRKPKQTPPQLF
jgi:hypothetical protein